MKYPDKLKKKNKSCPRRLTTVGLERQREGRDKTRDPGNLSAAFEALFTSMILMENRVRVPAIHGSFWFSFFYSNSLIRRREIFSTNTQSVVNVYSEAKLKQAQITPVEYPPFSTVNWKLLFDRELAAFRSDYENKIECEYDFRILNQSRPQNRNFSLLLTSREGSSRNKIGVVVYYNNEI